MPFYLKVIITCISMILLVVGLLFGYRMYKHRCSLNVLVPSSAKRKRTPKLGKSPDLSQYISERYPPSWRQLQRPRSSVVIQEMEMQPMLNQGSSRNAAPGLPPAIEAPNQVNESLHSSGTIPAIPESVAQALEDKANLNFEKYYKKKKTHQVWQLHNLQ